MNEEFDDRLKNRIADVFDNYEDESATEGWALLREKYPEKEKRRVLWLWWASAAALLLVVLSVGIALFNRARVNDIVRARHPVSQPVKSITTDTNAPKQTTCKDNLVADNTSKTNNQVKPSKDDNHAKAPKTIDPAIIANQHTHLKRIDTISNKYIAKAAINKHVTKIKGADITAHQNDSDPVNGKSVQTITVVPNKEQAKQTGPKGIDSAVLANNTTNTKTTQPEFVKPPVQDIKKPIFALLKPNDTKPYKPVDKKVKFGIYAATYFNYAKGSDNQFNVGAGFASEIKLVGNLKLLTGAVIGQNSLKYTSEVPQKATSYLAASIVNSSSSANSYAATAPSGTIVSSTNTSSDPILRNYQASLIGLDIPINLKYQLSKSDTYIAAGFSSGTYIVETYQFAYNYPASTGLSANNTERNTQTRTFLNTFDFARTLNFAFGMGYPIGKTNRLIIEPFVKYPLNGLGSQDLKFGAGGINLKFNFTPAKK
ncbi:MAG: hypothetical protein ABIN91_11805 [Mucilaginibacter sp.]|uniref:hypothetical protein n=1 Tax=Mucilaginibacter sp. TaxID=1882438 RepID=UPI00326545B6